MQSFRGIVEQIYSQTLFQINEPIWLQTSLKQLFPGQSFDPVSLDEYTQILENHWENLSHDQENRLLTEAIRSLLQALPDPYAAFLSPEDVNEETKEKKGKDFRGFGIEFAERGKQVFVAGVIPRSPAALAGLVSGDRLVRIDGLAVNSLQEAFENLHLRRSVLFFSRNEKIFHVALQPGPLHLIPFFARVFGKTGYIQMDLFSQDSDKLFREAVARLQGDGAKLLVLDLRDCIGGNVVAASRIAGFFLKPGDVIYTEVTPQNRIPRLNKDSIHYSIPLVILVDGSTASAAELVAGTLQDHHVAILYGTRTLGKGYIQTTWSLQGGWAFRLTTDAYLRPSGQGVQGAGIAPDMRCPDLLSCHKGEYGSQLEVLFRSLGKQ